MNTTATNTAMEGITLMHTTFKPVTVFAVVNAKDETEIRWVDRDQYKSQQVFIRINKRHPGQNVLRRLALTEESAERLMARFGK